MMADISTLTARINYGLGVAANIVGQPVTQYRPADILSPLDTSAVLGVIMAAFDAEPSLQFLHPAVIGRSLFYLLANTTTLQVGDYLVGVAGTFFIASLEPLRPPVVIRTNAVLSLVRPVTGANAGLNTPGGDSLSSETTVFAGWPASVLISGRGERGDVQLAGDVRMGGWQVLLPAVTGVDIGGSDILMDQDSLRRVVVEAELTATGWRIEAQQETS
jgi:hypothetical protein